jgi:SpoVK/Ycf46/Vps4 family AAA+-type ATPase
VTTAAKTLKCMGMLFQPSSGSLGPKEIFSTFLKDEDFSNDVILDLLAFGTEGVSGSDIRSLCGAAALAWSVEQSSVETLPSLSRVSLSDIEWFEKWLNQAR